MYQFRSIIACVAGARKGKGEGKSREIKIGRSRVTRVPEPLSADLMTMSFRLLSRILQVCRSRSVKLSLTGAGFSLKRSCSTASAKVSSAGSLCKGGVQLLLAYSTRRIRLLNSWKSALTSVQLMLREVGQKEKPLASNWFSS